MLRKSAVVLSLFWMFVGCATASAQQPHPEGDAAQFRELPSQEELGAILEDRLAVNGVGLVVGVVDATGPRVAARGRSGAPDDRPLDGDTVFQIGSVSKGITSLLLADMVVRGEVELDDPAGKYLPDGVTMPQKGRPITLRDLADHVSGLPSMPTNIDLNGKPDPIEAYSVDDLYVFLSSYTPERAPGEKSVYSNLGVALLGRLLANRIGTTYESLLQERIFGPLGMDSSSITLSDDQIGRLAAGHDRYLQPVRTMEMKTLQASGSIRSTANDMLKLISAYTGRRETPLKAAMALQLEEKLGWGVRPDGAAGHSGGKAGYRSAVLFDPVKGVGAVVLSNARTYDQPMTLARHLVSGEALEPAPPAPPAKPRIALPDDVLARYAGRYMSEEDRIYEVAVLGANLVIRYPDNAIYEFVASRPDEFFYHGGNDDVAFELNDEGDVIAMLVYGDGMDAGSEERATRMDES